jgi:hypothetical protein
MPTPREEVKQKLDSSPDQEVMRRLLRRLIGEKTNNLLNPFFKDIAEFTKSITAEGSKLGPVIARRLILDLFEDEFRAVIEKQRDKLFDDAMKLEFSN